MKMYGVQKGISYGKNLNILAYYICPLFEKESPDIYTAKINWHTITDKHNDIKI